MPRKKKTHEEYVNELKIFNSNIEAIEKYVDANTKILHKCKIDGYEWHVAPNALLHGNGCPMCYGNIKKTHDLYVEELSKINPNVEVIGNYINNKTKILHRCKIDGYEWEVRPSNMLSGKGCPVCSEKKKKTHKEYVSEVAELNKNIEVIGEYINCNTKILHRCKIDGHEWYATPNNILKGKGCSKCSGNVRKSHEEYIDNVHFVNQNIEVLGVYISAQTSILHKCKICGCEWFAKPNAILSGKGCPKCKESKGEKAVSFWLDKMNILYEPQKRFPDCKDIKPLPFDFYLPEYNICIEYQGQQHYESIEYFGGKSKFESQIKKDNIKKEYCQQNNIFLFEIPYYLDLDEELIKLYNLITMQSIEKGVVV